MKTSRYKFDELWHVAIKLSDIAPALAESIIRNYIEEGLEPQPEELTPGFMGVWTLIKAQIDQRKRRNLRARERRLQRRQSATVEATITPVDKISHDANRDLSAISSMRSETSSAFLPSSSILPEVSPPMPSATPLIEETQTLTSSTPSISRPATLPSPRKLPFASRFRGPGLGAIRRS